MARYLAPWSAVHRIFISCYFISMRVYLPRLFINFRISIENRCDIDRMGGGGEKGEQREDRTFPIIWTLLKTWRSDLYSNVFIISGQIEIGYFFVVLGIIIRYRRINEFVREIKWIEFSLDGSALFCEGVAMFLFKIMRRDIIYLYYKIAYLLNKLINYLINLNIYPTFWYSNNIICIYLCIKEAIV